MRALVVYESMYGNTHLVADAIGDGLAMAYDVDVVPVGQASARLLNEADLVVVGGPTHVHGVSRASTRENAVAQARRPGSALKLDPAAEGPGLRDWLVALPEAMHAAAAAFDTRVGGPAVLTGRAAKGIARGLRRHGLRLVAEPQSFLVTNQNTLQAGETTRARQWGLRLAGSLAAGSARTA